VSIGATRHRCSRNTFSARRSSDDSKEGASKRVHEFAFVLQPLKLRGATGSTGAPIRHQVIAIASPNGRR